MSSKTIENAPMLQMRGSVRFTGPSLLLVFRRLLKRTGIHITPHALRRTIP